jgi:hypothetical protein
MFHFEYLETGSNTTGSGIRGAFSKENGRRRTMRAVFEISVTTNSIPMRFTYGGH